MKRSPKIALGAAGIIMAASAWSLMGGEDNNLVYSDAAACRTDGKLSPAQCEERFEEARRIHDREARRFANQSGCESEYGSGRCQSISAGSAQLWVPALAGIMLARNLSASGRALPLLPPTLQTCPPGHALPDCRPSRSASGSGGRWYSTTSGRSVSTSRSSGLTRAAISSRGGFGGSGFRASGS